MFDEIQILLQQSNPIQGLLKLSQNTRQLIQVKVKDQQNNLQQAIQHEVECRINNTYYISKNLKVFNISKSSEPAFQTFKQALVTDRYEKKLKAVQEELALWHQVQPICELALAPAEVASRLQNIPVYAVANQKDQFVFVTEPGKESSNSSNSSNNNNTKQQQQGRQYGLLFLNKQDAESLKDEVSQIMPGAQSKLQVKQIFMDQVYHEIHQSRKMDKPVDFHFVPYSGEISNALQLVKSQGIQIDTIRGVPLFQAEGLTVQLVKNDDNFTPLFFCKSDLEVVVGQVKQRKGQQEKQDIDQRHSTLQKEHNELSQQISQEQNKQKKRQLQNRAKRIQDEIKLMQKQAEQSNKLSSAQPKVEVGTLEDVIMSMEADSIGEWKKVFFVPPGFRKLQQAKDLNSKQLQKLK